MDPLRKIFLPTPSVRRATQLPRACPLLLAISTHALREEGDGGYSRDGDWEMISTHALREEGDGVFDFDGLGGGDFYPRPP